MIQLSHVYKTYQSERHVLRDVNLSIEKPDIYFITGISGAGKTTLFKLLIGLEKPTSGEIQILGRHINKVPKSEFYTYRREIGVVFQDYKIIRDCTVRQNLSLPLTLLGWAENKVQAEVERLAESVGLGAYLDDFPANLSGGEQQRIAIGRALIHKPKIIFADEPTGNLDLETSRKIFSLFEVAKENGALVLVVTHDPQMPIKYGRETFHLKHGELTGSA